MQLVLEKLTVPAGWPETVNATGTALPVRSEALIVMLTPVPVATAAAELEADRENVVAAGGAAAAVVNVEPVETLRFPLASCEFARNS